MGDLPRYYKYLYTMRVALKAPQALSSLQVLALLDTLLAVRFWQKAVTRKDYKPWKLKRLVARLCEGRLELLADCADMLYRDPWLLCPMDEAFLLELYVLQARDYLQAHQRPADADEERMDALCRKHDLGEDERELVRCLWLAANYDWCAELLEGLSGCEETLHLVTGIDRARVRTLLRADAPLRARRVVLESGELAMEAFVELRPGRD